MGERTRGWREGPVSGKAPKGEGQGQERAVNKRRGLLTKRAKKNTPSLKKVQKRAFTSNLRKQLSVFREVSNVQKSEEVRSIFEKN